MTATARTFALVAATLGGSLLTGCVASALVDVATAPVRVVSKGVDLATTSQSEADEKRGRDLRRREERLGKLERDHARSAQRCRDGDDKACRRAAEELDAMRELSPGVPYERDR